jgi:phosphoribosylanthranilate isomerase
MAFPYYKAVRIRDPQDVQAIASCFSPRVLADAWSADAAGGTGNRIPAELAREAGKVRPLWLAGGIRPENVGEILDSLGPELIDASSGLEESPGRKDPTRLKTFFQEIRKHEKV